MLKRMLVVAVVVAPAACSSPAERPRAAAAPPQGSELGIFMKSQVNPPFSKISFLLFHQGDDDSEVDPGELPANAGQLAAAAERLGKWPDLPGESPQSKLVFHEYAEALRNDARSLTDAVRGDQREAMVKAFESLRRKCDSCHHFFRYDEETSRDGHTQDPGPRGR
jgi:hypothetical protein